MFCKPERKRKWSDMSMKKPIKASGDSGVRAFLSRHKRNGTMFEWLWFVGPIFVIYTMLFTVPFVQGIYYSFTDWNGLNPVVNFVGLANYKRLFLQDTIFHDSLKITANFAVWNVFLTNVVAMLFAVALTSKFKFNNMFRAAIFLPNMISMVVGGFIWLFMFTKISPAFYDMTNLAIFGRSWLGVGENVIFSIVIVSLWQGVGYIMTIYIAGLQGIDDSLIEAASIDGATGWQAFWRIKLPVMLPTITVGAFINIAGSLKIFDTVISLTGGGPGRASEMAMINIYREAFVNNNMAYGAAKATLLTLIIIIVAVLQFKFTANREVEQ